jgi:hypothetical protein
MTPMFLSSCPSRLYNVLREPRFASQVCPEMAEVTDLRLLGADNGVKQSTERDRAVICRLLATTEMTPPLGLALRTKNLGMSSRVLAARRLKYAPSAMIPSPMDLENNGPPPRPKPVKMKIPS